MKHLLITIAAVVLVGCGPSVPDISINKAAEDGNIEAVKQHLAAGTDVNSKALDLREDRRIFNGNSPLFFSSTKEVAEMLIANGAKINITYNGFIPSHFSAHEGHIEVTDLFIRKEANLNSLEIDGLTPLDFTNQPNNDVPTRFELKPELLDQNRIVTADLLRKHGGNRGTELKAKGK